MSSVQEHEISCCLVIGLHYLLIIVVRPLLCAQAWCGNTTASTERQLMSHMALLAISDAL